MGGFLWTVLSPDVGVRTPPRLGRLEERPVQQAPRQER